MDGRNNREKGSTLRLRDLTYERFIATTDRLTVALLLRAKRQFPFANDPEYARDIMLRGIRVNMHDPVDGPAKQVIDLFDMSYKLGLPIAGTLATALRLVIRYWWHERTYMSTYSQRKVWKRWQRIPLPFLDHVEIYKDGELTTRRYKDGKGYRDVSVKEGRIFGGYEGKLLSNPTLYNLWHFIISVYAARKLEKLRERYEDGSNPLILQEVVLEEIVEEVEDTNPVGEQEVKEKKMTHYMSQKHLAELFVMLERQGYIDEVSNVAISRAFHRTKNIRKYLNPHREPDTGERNFFDLFTIGFEPLFDKLPQNPEKIID